MGIVHLYVYEDHKAILNIIAIRKEYQLSGFGSLSIKKIEQLLFKKNIIIFKYFRENRAILSKISLYSYYR